MSFDATFHLNRSYFEEIFEQWLKHRSRFRRRQIQIAVALFLLGVFFSIRDFSATPIILVVIGIVEFVEFFIYRSRWINKRLAARVDNEHDKVEITVDEFGISQKGPTGEGKMTWAAVKAVLPTTEGMFMAIGDGMSIYVPNSGMSDGEFRNFVLRMVERN